MILHVDMDAFYASIEQRDRPELRGQPVVVGGSTAGRGVVAAASYEARRFGIHSAMSGKRARQLCPAAIFVKSDIQKYAAVGKQVREIFKRFSPTIQPLSLDEAFLDVQGTLKLLGSAEAIGHAIKRAIQDELGLSASVGIAPLKFVAKIASDLGKPNGFVVVQAAQTQAFLDPLPVSRLWGVGAVGQQRLASLGVHRIVDLRVRDEGDLKRRFGQWGSHLWRLANGIDPRGVVPDRVAKQIGHERTFQQDLDEDEMLHSVISHLAQQVGYRLRRSERLAGSVGLKYRSDDFRTFSRSRVLKNAADSTHTILGVAAELLAEMRVREPAKVRLIGVSVGNLSAKGLPQQLDLFDSEQQQQQQKMDRLVDALTDAKGRESVYRASSHRWMHRRDEA